MPVVHWSEEIGLRFSICCLGPIPFKFYKKFLGVFNDHVVNIASVFQTNFNRISSVDNMQFLVGNFCEDKACQKIKAPIIH